MPQSRRRLIAKCCVIPLGLVALPLALWSWQRSNELDSRFIGMWHMSEEGAIWLDLHDGGISQYKTSTAIGAESKWWIADGSLCIEYNAHPPLSQKVQRVFRRLLGNDPANLRLAIVDVQAERIRLQFPNGKPLTLIRGDVPSRQYRVRGASKSPSGSDASQDDFSN